MMRDAQQSKAKTRAFDFIKTNNNCGFILRDWAMKILPMFHREAMTDYFGKRGMSLHMDIIYYVSDGLLHKAIYATICHQAEQSLIDVLDVSKAVLEHFHKEHPEIDSIIGKNDRAKCYTGNG